MRVDIRGADKGIGKFASLVVADKIFLVHARRQLNDFLRHVQKCGVEAAKHWHGPFGQARIFDDQTFIFHQVQASSLRRRLRAVMDDAAAFGEMDEDMGSAQLLNIIPCIADGNSAAVVEAMAHRLRAANNPLNFAMHHRIAEQRHDALQLAHPAQAFGGNRRCAPALRFRPWKGTDDRGDRLCQNIGRLTPCFFNYRIIDAIAFDQLVLRKASFTQKPFHRLRRCTDLWPLGFFGHSLSRQRQSSRDKRKTARRGKGVHRCRGKTSLSQGVIKQAGQVFLGLQLHPRGDFFGAQFKQEVGHTAHPFFSIHAWQLPLARSRTRPI